METLSKLQNPCTTPCFTRDEKRSWRTVFNVSLEQGLRLLYWNVPWQAQRRPRAGWQNSQSDWPACSSGQVRSSRCSAAGPWGALAGGNTCTSLCYTGPAKQMSKRKKNELKTNSSTSSIQIILYNSFIYSIWILNDNEVKMTRSYNIIFLFYLGSQLRRLLVQKSFGSARVT